MCASCPRRWRRCRRCAVTLDRRRSLVFVGDLAHDLLEDVLDRDQPGGAAVLVEHDRQVHLARAHLLQQLPHDLGAAARRAGVRSSPSMGGVSFVAEVGQQVLHEQHARDVVRRFAIHGQPGEAAFAGTRQRLLDRVASIGSATISVRGVMMCPAVDVAQVDDAFDHALLGVLEGAFACALVDGAQDLVRRSPRSGRRSSSCVVAPQDAGGGAAQHGGRQRSAA